MLSTLLILGTSWLSRVWQSLKPTHWHKEAEDYRIRPPPKVHYLFPFHAKRLLSQRLTVSHSRHWLQYALCNRTSADVTPAPACSRAGKRGRGGWPSSILCRFVDADYTAWASALAALSTVVSCFVYCKNGICIEKRRFIASNFSALMDMVPIYRYSARISNLFLVLYKCNVWIYFLLLLTQVDYWNYFLLSRK